MKVNIKQATEQAYKQELITSKDKGSTHTKPTNNRQYNMKT